MKLRNRKIIYLKMHQGLFVPAIGDLGNVLPTQGKTVDNLSMTTAEDGDGVAISGARNGANFEVFVPSANIAYAALAVESGRKDGTEIARGDKAK